MPEAEIHQQVQELPCNACNTPGKGVPIPGVGVISAAAKSTVTVLHRAIYSLQDEWVNECGQHDWPKHRPTRWCVCPPMRGLPQRHDFLPIFAAAAAAAVAAAAIAAADAAAVAAAVAAAAVAPPVAPPPLPPPPASAPGAVSSTSVSVALKFNGDVATFQANHLASLTAALRAKYIPLGADDVAVALSPGSVIAAVTIFFTAANNTAAQSVAASIPSNPVTSPPSPSPRPRLPSPSPSAPRLPAFALRRSASVVTRRRRLPLLPAPAGGFPPPPSPPLNHPRRRRPPPPPPSPPPPSPPPAPHPRLPLARPPLALASTLGRRLSHPLSRALTTWRAWSGHVATALLGTMTFPIRSCLCMRRWNCCVHVTVCSA